MKSIDFNKRKFKLRSLPNSKTFSKYLENYLYFVLVLVIFNLLYICLFSSGLVPILPTCFVLAIPVVFCHTYISFEHKYQNVRRETVKEIIVHIRLKQTQSLIEKLENNPEILNSYYNKKSLLYWAKHHRNIEANSIIIEQMKKTAK